MVIWMPFLMIHRISLTGEKVNISLIKNRTSFLRRTTANTRNTAIHIKPQMTWAERRFSPPPKILRIILGHHPPMGSRSLFLINPTPVARRKNQQTALNQCIKMETAVCRLIIFLPMEIFLTLLMLGCSRLVTDQYMLAE